MAAKRKSFKDNPAMQFLSVEPPVPKPEPQAVAPAAPKPPAAPPPKAERPALGTEAVPMKPNPAYIETRSKRVQLLMQPSLHSSLKRIAGEKGVSLNDLVHGVLEAYAKENQ